MSSYNGCTAATSQPSWLPWLSSLWKLLLNRGQVGQQRLSGDGAPRSTRARDPRIARDENFPSASIIGIQSWVFITSARKNLRYSRANIIARCKILLFHKKEEEEKQQFAFRRIFRFELLYKNCHSNSTITFVYEAHCEMIQSRLFVYIAEMVFCVSP